MLAAIVRFLYAKDGKAYKGMIYDYNKEGSMAKVAYLTEHSIDVQKGPEWGFVRQFPCSLNVGNPFPLAVASMSRDSTGAPDSQRISNRSRPTERKEAQEAVSSGRITAKYFWSVCTTSSADSTTFNVHVQYK